MQDFTDFFDLFAQFEVVWDSFDVRFYNVENKLNLVQFSAKCKNIEGWYILLTFLDEHFKFPNQIHCVCDFADLHEIIRESRCFSGKQIEWPAIFIGRFRLE